jgi:ElaB/YqjD/DUF883 family membrane-anchored ribosome-binding protein
MAEDPDAIRREIADTREEIAETIDAIEYKADVPSRAGDRVSELRETVAGRADSLRASIRRAPVVEDNPLLLAAGAAAAGFLIGLALPSARTRAEP